MPVKDGEYFYYVKYVSGGEYPIYCRKHQSLDASEEIMLDGNTMAKDKNYFKNNKSFTIDTRKFKRGNYVLHLDFGKFTDKKQIILR